MPYTQDDDVSKAGKRRRLRKAKSGKVDVIEDLVDLDVPDDFYEKRDAMAKQLAIDKAKRAAQDRKVEKIFRERRRKALEAQLLDRDQIEAIQLKVEFLLREILDPAAFEYLNIIREKDNILCHKICYALFPPKDMRRIDDLYQRAVRHGYKGKKIDLTTIIKYERAFKGIKPKMEVERDGKRIDIREQIGARKVA